MLRHPTRLPVARRRSGALPLVAGLAALLLAACGPTGGATTGATADARPSTPPLADVTPLADPASYVGPSTAVLGPSDAAPVDGPAPSLPAQVVDAQGTAVTVDSVDRVLALDLYGSLAQTVHELGLGGSLVGRDVSSSFPGAEDLPLVTQGGHTLNGEAVLALEPTLVVTDTTLGPWDVVLQLRDAGVPVVVVTPERSVASTPALVEAVAAALGVPERGRTLAERVQADVDAVLADVADVAPQGDARLRTVFLYVRGSAGVYQMMGAGSGADSLISAVGGLDVATEIGWEGTRPLTDEGLVAAAPDLVLVMTKGLESVGGVDGLLEQVPALAQTPAGRNHRVVDMADTQVLSFGPRTADVVDALASAIYAPGGAGA